MFQHIFQKPEISEVQILYCHLYQNPNHEDRQEPALKFKIGDIMSAVFEHHLYQQNLDREAKGEFGTEAEDRVEEEVIRRLAAVGLQLGEM
jgi:hypothetical protein